MRFYRETWAEVHLDALADNIHALGQHHRKALIAIIKANAYGHGDVMIARQALDSGAQLLAVSSLDEALSLRYKDIDGEILILGHVAPKDLAVVKQHNLILTVTSLEWARSILNQHPKGLRTHLKIDTGMNRMGLKSLQEAQEVLQAFDEAQIHIEGLYTHFASSDDPSDTQTKQQYQRFETLYAALGRSFRWVHCSNSDAAIHFDTPLCNAVRIGLALFGYASYPFPLKPVMILKTKLVNVKTIQAGETVSYGATYTASRNETIATIPIGYADGWNRRHQGDVCYVDGHACEYIGRICMDQCMIRLPHVYPEGTEVELLGTQAKLIPMAAHLHTIPYEILTQLSDRIPKVYLQHGQPIATINPRLPHENEG
jgi:alanine racemase